MPPSLVVLIVYSKGVRSYYVMLVESKITSIKNASLKYVSWMFPKSYLIGICAYRVINESDHVWRNTVYLFWWQFFSS